jgi:hypothetical protein
MYYEYHIDHDPLIHMKVIVVILSQPSISTRLLETGPVGDSLDPTDASEDMTKLCIVLLIHSFFISNARHHPHSCRE